MSEDSIDISPHLPPIALTDTAPRADGPAFEIWTPDHVTKFGVVYQADGLWIASANIEFPQPFRARDDAIAMLVLFRGKFPTPPNPDDEPADLDITDKGPVELRFPLRRVLDIAEHTAAATDHRPLYDQRPVRPALWWVKDDGTYLMSNAARTGDDAIQVVYAEGWGPGTDPASLLGGDDFAELFDLHEPMDGNTGDTLLDFLRKAVDDGYVHVLLTVTARQVAFAVTQP
ncbi:hypothetical protein ABIA39_003430 [Nocardia sp. GAS34]|uniref:DUF3085 domain-containing protein n=1 Tax=unclassified Nocardia TaxID=2637762 RepID=UPI003D1C87F2